MRAAHNQTLLEQGDQGLTDRVLVDAKVFGNLNDGCLSTDICQRMQNLALSGRRGRKLGHHVFDADGPGLRLAVDHCLSLCHALRDMFFILMQRKFVAPARFK